MSFENDLWEIQIMAHAVEMEIVDLEDLVNNCDKVIMENTEVPYYVIAFSLGEYKGKGLPDGLINFDNGTSELLFILRYSVGKYQRDKNINQFLYRMQYAWDYFKYPDIMREYYPLIEEDGTGLRNRVEQYITSLIKRLA